MTHKKNQTVARLAYQERAAKRHVLANQAHVKNIPKEDIKMNWKTFFLSLIVVLVVSCMGFSAIGAGLFIFWPRPDTVTYIQPATTPAPTLAPAAPAGDQPAWLGANSEGMLPSGNTAIGDVKVNDKVYYDSGSGEATVVLNHSNKEVKIGAEWGASMVEGTDEKAIGASIWATGCDQNNGGCSRIRWVTVTDSGITQRFENRPIPPTATPAK